MRSGVFILALGKAHVLATHSRACLPECMRLCLGGPYAGLVGQLSARQLQRWQSSGSGTGPPGGTPRALIVLPSSVVWRVSMRGRSCNTECATCMQQCTFGGTHRWDCLVLPRGAQEGSMWVCMLHHLQALRNVLLAGCLQELHHL